MKKQIRCTFRVAIDKDRLVKSLCFQLFSPLLMFLASLESEEHYKFTWELLFCFAVPQDKPGKSLAFTRQSRQQLCLVTEFTLVSPGQIISEPYVTWTVEDKVRKVLIEVGEDIQYMVREENKATSQSYQVSMWFLSKLLHKTVWCGVSELAASL